MTKVISFVLKILYWSIVWAGGLGWVIYKERFSIPIILFVGVVGGIFGEKLLLLMHTHETELYGPSKLYSSGGILWALIWTTIFVIVTILSSSSCPGSSSNNYTCVDFGFLGKIFIVIFGSPIVGLYTRFIGSLGTIIYILIFGVSDDLKI